jgi:hypothetical protein
VIRRSGLAVEPVTPGTGPAWSARLLWGAYGLLAGFATGTLFSLALLSVAGPLAAQFVFRLCAYGFILAGLDYGGERPRWRQALLRGFGLAAAIAILRIVFAIL